MSSTDEQQITRSVAVGGEAPRAPGIAAATPSRPPTTGISWRAILIGALLIPVVCIWNEYDEIVAEGTDLVAMSLIISVVILLFFLVLINLALKKWAPRIAFSQAELMYIYIMMTVSVGISGIGMTQFLVPQLGNLYHFANATNKWEDFWPYVPRWFVPRRSVLPDFYAGQSTFYTWAHFSGWLVPILVWSGFILMALRTHFIWWPLHPIGYAIAGTFTMDWLWFPTLMGWLVKALTIRYGGMKLYRTLIPFFIGLILGDYVIGGLWSLVGLAFDIRVYRCFPI